MRRILGIELLRRVRCLATIRAIAAITKAEVIDKSLSQLQLAAGPQLTADGEPMPSSSDWGGLDPPGRGRVERQGLPDATGPKCPDSP